MTSLRFSFAAASAASNPCASTLGLLVLVGCTSDYQPKPLAEDEVLARLNEPVQIPDLPGPPPGVGLALERPALSAEAPREITLEQAQALAIARHPVLRRLRAERGIADAADVFADSSPDPELSATAFWITPQAVLGGLASLRWELLASGTSAARHGLAGALRDSCDARLAAEEWRVAGEARVAWLELAAREREVDVAGKRVAAAVESREFAARMLERGATTRIDAALIELEAAEAERDRTAAAGALRTARARLAEAAALPPGLQVRTPADGDPLEPLEPRIPPGDADALLCGRRPELRDARARYQVAERELELACLRGLARFSVGPDAERDADSTKLGAGGSVVLPISDANRAAIVEATTRRDIAGRDLEIDLFEARARLARAREEEDAAARALAAHENRVAPAAAAALDAAEKAASAGASDLLPLLIARQRALESSQARIGLLAAHAVAVARLESAFGPEPAPEHGSLAQTGGGR